jgi:hypothetical protein
LRAFRGGKPASRVPHSFLRETFAASAVNHIEGTNFGTGAEPPAEVPPESKMRALPILPACALLGIIAITTPAGAAYNVHGYIPANVSWTANGFVVQNKMSETPAAPNGVGSEIGRAVTGSRPNPAMATSGQTVAFVSGSGSENHAAVTRFAAGESASQVASASNGAILR